MRLFYLLLPFAVLSTAAAQISIKMASKYDLFQYGLSKNTVILLVTNPYVWGSVISYFLSFILSIKIFELANLSIIAPVFMGMVLFCVVTFSCIFFDEQLTIRIIAGQCMILAGAFLVLTEGY